ncbi:hypothetical protein IVB18_26230 [Bradyrhizobium sp. 186]|uniref:hypothetical protein n=1 Tax=Bradyrhizobium sp. 186 TaxID=2782654 RepID=UPI002000936A|nr:hypothetical protein [Bradyrhizobium sp. 186]UPK31830.1 hypothetical protein IVB18_26230 [Bradyrhizobium sp. 186]
MVKVIATTKGYFAHTIREMGEAFAIPDEIWEDVKRRPSWVVLAGAAAAVEAVEVKPAAELIVIPADWEDMSAADRRALASKISGAEVKRAPDADKIIEAYVEANKPAPFDDAPEPQTVAQAQKAAGGVEPDWIAPGEPKPVAD